MKICIEEYRLSISCFRETFLVELRRNIRIGVCIPDFNIIVINLSLNQHKTYISIEVLYFTVSNNELTLKEFIEENHRLLTVISVFGALTSVFLSPSIYEKNPSISFFTFIMFLLLSLELISSNNMLDFMPFDTFNKNPSKLLKIFTVCFVMFIVLVAGQILSNYRNIILGTLFLIVPFVNVYLTGEAIIRYNIFNLGNNRLISYGIFLITILLSILLVDYFKRIYL